MFVSFPGCDGIIRCSSYSHSHTGMVLQCSVSHCIVSLSWAGVPAKVAHTCRAAEPSWMCWEFRCSKVLFSPSSSSDKPLLTVFIWHLLGSFPVLLHLLPSAQPVMGRCQNFSFCSQGQISTTLLKYCSNFGIQEIWVFWGFLGLFLRWSFFLSE